MSKLIRVRVIVRGRDPFPIDMLRYDCVYPSRETDSHVIERLGTGYNLEELGEQEVTVERMAEPKWKPTEGRWESRGWKVKAVVR
jgi:hypothetical protein